MAKHLSSSSPSGMRMREYTTARACIKQGGRIL
jgi:hypothetical protein